MGLRDKASKVLDALKQGDGRQAASAVQDVIGSARVRLMDEVVSRLSGHAVHTDADGPAETPPAASSTRAAPPEPAAPPAPAESARQPPRPLEEDSSRPRSTDRRSARTAPAPRGEPTDASPPSFDDDVATRPGSGSEAGSKSSGEAPGRDASGRDGSDAAGDESAAAASTEAESAPGAERKSRRRRGRRRGRRSRKSAASRDAAPAAADSAPLVPPPPPELPVGYHQNRLVLLARDPAWAFAYWEFSPARLAKVSEGLTDPRAMLRFYEVGDKTPLIDADVDPENGRYYLRVPRPGRTYEARLVLVGAHGEVREVARSNDAEPPSRRPGEELAPPRFVRMDAQTKVLDLRDVLTVPPPRLVMDAAASAAPNPESPLRNPKWSEVVAWVRSRRVAEAVADGGPAGSGSGRSVAPVEVPAPEGTLADAFQAAPSSSAWVRPEARPWSLPEA